MVFVSCSSKKTRPGSSEIRRRFVSNVVRNSVYSLQFVASSEQPTRSKSATATSSASGAQSSGPKPGSFVLVTVSLTIRSKSITLADSPAPSEAALVIGT